MPLFRPLVLLSDDGMMANRISGSEPLERNASMGTRVGLQEVPEMTVLTDSNFFTELSENELMVVHCWAHWSSRFGEVNPTIEELAREYQGKVVFGKLNVEDNPMVSEIYAVNKIPNILIFKHGREVDELAGSAPKTYIKAKFKRHFESN